jgi:hypothetical protein
MLTYSSYFVGPAVRASGPWRCRADWSTAANAAFPDRALVPDSSDVLVSFEDIRDRQASRVLWPECVSAGRSGRTTCTQRTTDEVPLIPGQGAHSQSPSTSPSRGKIQSVSNNHTLNVDFIPTHMYDLPLTLRVQLGRSREASDLFDNLERYPC